MARGPKSVAGKSVLITGAARGIGAETARRLARRGARVSVVGLEPEMLEQVAKECGDDAVWFEADITDRAALDRAVAGTVERFGSLDVAFANAGIGSGGTVRTMPDEDWERVIQVNLLGTYRTVRACLPRVLESRGYVLVMSSIAALLPDAVGMSSYSTSKAGIEAFARSLRSEVRHLGVTVGLAYFGWIDTDLVRGADAESPAFRALRESLKGPAAKTMPLGDAADGIVDGIERRKTTVAGPGWVRAFIPLRGVLAPLVVRASLKDAPAIVHTGEASAEELGPSAFAPAGAGGRAAARAAEERDELSGASK